MNRDVVDVGIGQLFLVIGIILNLEMKGNALKNLHFTAIQLEMVGVLSGRKQNDTTRRDNKPAFGPGRGGPMGAAMGSGEKPKSFRKAMKTFLKYLAPYRFSLALVLIFAIASTVFMIVGPKMLGNATTKLFQGIVAKVTHVPGATVDFHYIGRIAIILLILYVASAIFSFIPAVGSFST